MMTRSTEGGLRVRASGSEFDEFFDQHYDPVVRALTMITGDRARAEDAAQEAFATAFRKWPTVRQLDRPVGWVVVVGTNRLKRWFTTEEKRMRRFESAATTAGGVREGGDHASTVSVRTTVREVLSALPPRQRATVVLRYLEDLSTEEVATALGCAPGTVKSALHAALAAMRVELGEEAELHRWVRPAAPPPDPGSGPPPDAPKPTRPAPNHESHPKEVS